MFCVGTGSGRVVDALCVGGRDSGQAGEGCEEPWQGRLNGDALDLLNGAFNTGQHLHNLKFCC